MYVQFKAMYVAGHVCVQCVSCVSGTHAQLPCWLNMHAGKQQPYPSAWAETAGPWCTRLGSRGWTGGAPEPELLEVVSGPNIL